MTNPDPPPEPLPLLHQADMTITLSHDNPATDQQLLAVLTRRVTHHLRSHLRSLLVIRPHPDPPHLPLAHYVITPPDTTSATIPPGRTTET